MKKVEIFAYAKINLLLDIIKTLDNGYHSLFMLMQSVTLHDTVTVGESDTITVTCTESSLPCDERNLAARAARAFFDATGLRAGAEIHVDKRIPLAAGLAGGSADAAAVITALNLLYQTHLSGDRLCKIGLSVGADVPFCLVGGTMLAQNVGEVLSPLPSLPECSIVIAKPAMSVSTAEAYAAFDSAQFIHRPDCALALYAAASGDLEGLCRYSDNVFEQVIEVPQRVDIRHVMNSHGSLLTRMSGSGPSVFGIFNSRENAEKCAELLKESVKDVFICQPAAAGCEIVQRGE